MPALSGAGLPLDIVSGLTLLAIAPFVLVMMTPFVRIIVVLSLVRTAMGAQTLPPNIVLTGLALVLTFVTMTPTLEAVSHDALAPYAQGRISREVMAQRAFEPLHDFMLRQTLAKDIRFFNHVAKRTTDDIAGAPLCVVVPAFVVGELRSGFAMGFALYLPFIAIDLAVSAILMGLGMMMLSPNVVSLPCKLFLFVVVDGWALVCGGVASSFR